MIGFTRRTALYLPLIALIFPFALPALSIATLDPALQTRVDRIAQQVLDQTGVPSASVAVVQHGKLAYTHAYRSARLATATTPAIPATPEMRYSIGSISKQFTAAAILLLQEEGKLILDDPVGKYVPGLTRGVEVTIGQIQSIALDDTDEATLLATLERELPRMDPRPKLLILNFPANPTTQCVDLAFFERD